MASNLIENGLAVVGAGTMGAGIAQLAAANGWNVFLADVSVEAVERGIAGIRKQLERLVEKGSLSPSARDVIAGRIHPARPDQEFPGIRLAIEAVVEDLAIKRKVFEQLEAATSEEAILATNTSSLSVSAIAESARYPARILGMHFFNPAPVMPLVEIIAARQSDAKALERATKFAQDWGKTTVRAKDTPGFIVNRVARGYYLEALRLLGEGVGGVDEIDNVMRRLGRFRMGPFELMDLVGLDVNLAVSTSVWEQMQRPARFAPHAIQEKLVSQGHLGRKTGRGFYVYDGAGPLPAIPVDRKSYALTPLMADALRVFTARAAGAEAGPTEQLIFSRILSAVLNEAGWALAEEVADEADIDLAMLKGTNYPRGPLAWAREIGPRTVRGVLVALNHTVEDHRFAPAPLFARAD